MYQNKKPNALVTKIPDRWMDYKSMGRQISGTRLIAFKTPLTVDTCKKVSNSDAHFTPRFLMDHCSSLGLVIDITFKQPGYYYPKELMDQKIDFLKIAVPGQTIPGDHFVFEFFKAVEDFLKKNKDNDKLIGVHCTHGLNRTGYLICRYMIECLKVPADQAILDFNSARGHNQERENYLTSLRQTVPNDKYLNWLRPKNATTKLRPRTRFASRANTSSNWRNSPSNPSPADNRRKSRKRSIDHLEVDSPNGHHQAGGPEWPSKRARYDNRSPYNTQRPNTRSTAAIESPLGHHGRDYYQQYYRGSVYQQYNMNFYQNNKDSSSRWTSSDVPTVRDRKFDESVPDTSVMPPSPQFSWERSRSLRSTSKTADLSPLPTLRQLRQQNNRNRF